MMYSDSPENPREPVTIEESSESVVIECPRCTGRISLGPRTVVRYSSTRDGWDRGQSVITVDEQATSKGEVPSLTTCSVCGGKSKLRIERSPPLPVCGRCRGRGYVVKRSKRLEYLEEIEELERASRERTAAREPDGLLDRLRFMLSTTPEAAERQRVEAQMDADRFASGPDNRILRVRNCPTCGGVGVEADDAEPTVTECQRCDGVGRMVTRSFRSVTNSLSMAVEDGCEVCDGTGELAVDVGPPFTECPRCDGFGRTDESNSHDGPATQVTCSSCDGWGFHAEGDLATY